MSTPAPPDDPSAAAVATDVATSSASAGGVPDPDAPKGVTTISYVPALDGIRGLAMLVIMGYHAGVFLTAGGFYSLDTFFALSGFLITTLLISERQRKGSINLGLFWARRARRLLPGLLLLLVAVALYAEFVIPHGTYPELRLDELSSLLYVANWHFILQGSNYFAQQSLTSPVLHTWSLAVEEQFYLVWPLVVLLVFKLTGSLRTLLVTACVGALASALEMALLLQTGSSVNRLYYGTDTRAQSLLAGAALAAGLAMFAEHRRRRGLPAGALPPRAVGGDPTWEARTVRGRQVVVAAGFLGIVGSGLLWTLVNENQPFAFQGGFLLAALSTVALLFGVVSAQRSPVARILSFSPLRYLGRISYGMYLWHFPLFAFLDHARVGLYGWPLFAVRAAATIFVANASFHLVELPIRQGEFFKQWRAWLSTPIAMVVTAVIVVAGTVTPALAGPVVTGPVGSSALYHGPKVRVLLVGDSDALTLGIGLSNPAPKYDVKEYDKGILGCGVTSSTTIEVQGSVDLSASNCNPAYAKTVPQWPALWSGWIAEYHPNVVMILAGRWEVIDRTFHGKMTDITNPAYAAYVKRQLNKAVGIGTSKGARVVLLTAPCYDTGEQPDGSPWPEDAPVRVDDYNRLVWQVAAEHPKTTTVVNLHQMACPGGHYQEYLDGTQLRESDGIHFTWVGGELLAPKIWPTVVKVGRQQMQSTGRS